MAKYQTFAAYWSGENMKRYQPFFKLCWNFATAAAEEKILQSASPTNSDYTAALEKELSNFDDEILIMFDVDIHELATRLNSVVKAQQNCA